MTLTCQSFAKGIFNLEINEGTIVSIYLFIYLFYFIKTSPKVADL